MSLAGEREEEEEKARGQRDYMRMRNWVELAKTESSSRIMCNWGAVICQNGRVSAPR